MNICRDEKTQSVQGRIFGFRPLGHVLYFAFSDESLKAEMFNIGKYFYK